MKLGLTARLLLATAALVVVVGTSFAVLLLALREERAASALVAESERVLVAAGRLERLVIDLETGQRGFVLTGEERFLEPWREARAAMPGAIRDLVTFAEVPSQDRRARRVGDTIESYVARYSVPLIQAARSGDPTALSVATTAEGKDRVDALRDQFDQLIARERSLSVARKDRADDATRWAIVATTGGLVGSVVIILAYSGYLTRSIVAPVRRASTMARRLAGGELDVRMAGTAPGEIGTLVDSFNTMATSLEQSRDDLTRLLDQQAALRRVATLVARGVAPSDVFAAVTAEMSDLLDVDSTWLIRYERDGTAVVVAAQSEQAVLVPVGAVVPFDEETVIARVQMTGRPARRDSLETASGPGAARLRELGIRSSAGAPVVVAGQLWGAMTVAWRRSTLASIDAEARVVEFTELVAAAIANAESRAELAASRARIVETADDARRRIERNLHDGVQQRLVSLGLDLRAIEGALPPEMDRAKADLARTLHGLTAAVEDLQEVARGIHPAILSKGGLGPALKSLARRSGLPVELELRGDHRAPEAVEVAAYYVVSEGLTNAAKHAQASVVEVDVEVDEHFLRLSVRDDGVGGADPRLGSGLVGLRDRVEAVGGTMDVTSSVAGGTALVVAMPILGPI